MLCDQKSTDSILVDINGTQVKIFICDECSDNNTIKSLRKLVNDKIIESTSILEKFGYKIEYIHKQPRVAGPPKVVDPPKQIETVDYSTVDEPAKLIQQATMQKEYSNDDIKTKQLLKSKDVKIPQNTNTKRPEEIKVEAPENVREVEIDPKSSAMAQISDIVKSDKSKLNIKVVSSNNDGYSPAAAKINSKFDSTENAEVDNYSGDTKCRTCNGVGFIQVKNKQYKCTNKNCIDGIIV